MALESDETLWDVFNVGSGTPITVTEIALTLARRLDKDIEPELLGRYRIGDIRHCFPDVSKIERTLGFTPRRNFDEGMQELVAWVVGEREKQKLLA
jgi:dTDP-L-rhamnose 4-epimerase